MLASRTFAAMGDDQRSILKSAPPKVLSIFSAVLDPRASLTAFHPGFPQGSFAIAMAFSRVIPDPSIHLPASRPDRDYNQD